MSEIKKKYWLTHFEKSDFEESPDYIETLEYFQKFEQNTDAVKIITFGNTPQQRELKLVIVNHDGIFTPADIKKSGKAVVLIQNGIHPGEIEGKDASMLLLREILISGEKKNLLDKIVLLIIPVFNADGHERISPFNRPNQNGPRKTGWRTNALNLNLNRDYMKADSPEMRAWLNMFNLWLPDFIIDNHTTNGADYQYHVTYGIEKHQNIHPALSKWSKNKYLPYLLRKVENDGFLTGPYMEFKNGTPESGIIQFASLPRYSTGYCALQNRICLLVETHSLKPFRNRVYSTKSVMEHSLVFINKNAGELINLNKQADRETLLKYCSGKSKFPVRIAGKDSAGNFRFKGVEHHDEYSQVTGSEVRRYTGKPVEFEIPVYNKTEIEKSVIAPFAYSIPVEFNFLTELLAAHGIEYHRLIRPKEINVEKYKFTDVKFWQRPYEGRQLAEYNCKVFPEKVKLGEGTIIIPVKQRTFRIILNLFEPESPDSLAAWGFFNAFFERKEYAEVYIMEPVAEKMLNEEEKIRNEFLNKLEEEDFRNNPAERLDFFYRNSPFFDQRENVYPIFRIPGKF
ncbi:MAG: M14 family metallopeptidase [Ignavibacteriaceae bacterium]